MGKKLVIRKPDKSIHVTEISNKAALLQLNKRFKAGQKWKFEEMDEEDANKLPAFDKNYVTAAEAVQKVDVLKNQLQDKDKQIEELKALLAKNNPPADPPKQLTVPETVELIKAATTVDEVNKIVGADERKGVLTAAEVKVAELGV